MADNNTTGCNEATVHGYLKSNPDFTKSWFIKNIGPLTLQGWLQNKDRNHNDNLGANDLENRIGDEGRNSITKKMFHQFVTGRNKQNYTIRTRSELVKMSQMDMFMELIRDIANELDVDILCHKILTNVSLLTRGDRGSLFLIRGSKDQKYLVSKLFDVRAESTFEESLHTTENQIRVPLGKGIAGTVALTQQPINIKNAYDDERFNHEIDKQTGYRTRSLLCLPILNYEGDTVGVAQIMNKAGDDNNDGFTEQDEGVFRNYLTFCGIGLTNAQLFEMSVQEYKRNQLLLSLAKGIFAEQQNLDKLVEKILLDSQELLHCQRCCVYLIEELIEGDTFMYRGMYSQAVENCTGKSLKYKQGKEIYLKHHDAVREIKRKRSESKFQIAQKGGRSGDKSDKRRTRFMELINNSGGPGRSSCLEVVFTKAFELQIDSDELTGTVKNPSNEELSSSKCADLAKQVAITGKVLNVSDTVSDPQVGEEVRYANEEEITDYDGFVVHSILSLPIRDSEERVIGVVQLMNKVNGKPFSEADINVVEAFAIFCGLGIHNCQMYESACKLMARQSVALEVLSYHAMATPEETQQLVVRVREGMRGWRRGHRVVLEVLSYHAMAAQEETQQLVKSDIPSASSLRLYTYDFNDLPLSELETCQATVRMFLDMGVCDKFNVPYEVLCRWTLSVKRNYRPVTYHNWRHAFNVAQTMFTMLYTGRMKKVISEIEMFALVVACLSHDLDHRGTNNAFQSKVESPLAQLYSTSTMEHHHFDQCIMILNSEGNNIFMHLSPREYRDAIRVVESAILSTDLALYFRKKGSFQELIDKGEKDWRDQEKRDLLRGMMMTACDVAAITKPWEIQKEVAQLVANEFFEQGDLERMQLQAEPIAMMDRRKKDELPKMQVGFIDAICLPVYSMLAQVEKGLSPLKEGCVNNRNNWQNLADAHESSVRGSVSEESNTKAQPKPENLNKKENESSKLTSDSPLRKISNTSINRQPLNNQQKQNNRVHTDSQKDRPRKISNHSIRNQTRNDKQSKGSVPDSTPKKSRTCTIL